MIPTIAFGNTGLELPRMGLGLAALGRPGYINLGHAEDLAQNYVVEAMKGRTHRMLDLAFDKGMRYFDVARSYGRAEAFVRSWLDIHQPDPKKLTVGSKWGYAYTANWKVQAENHEIKEHSLEQLTSQWKESKKLLPYLKIYQIHSATFESGVLTNRKVLEELGRLKAQGLLIGLSLSGHQQATLLNKAMLVRVDGKHLFDTVQLTYNLLDRSTEDIVTSAAESGMGIIVKEALANGRLTSRNRAPEFSEKKKALERMAKEKKVAIDAIALAYILTKPWAHVVLSGAATERHLLSNLDAFNVKFSEDELTTLHELAVDEKVYWKKRSELSWN